jgi:DNA-binding GntR family transcriptional regulator
VGRKVVSTSDKVGTICRALRRAIMEQALEPGSKLPEDSLGERFGVSRTIARYALGQLASEGLVELRRNRIAVVFTPSWQDARDTFDVRMELERLVIRQIAGRLDPKQIAKLRAHVDAEIAARDGPNPVSIRLATEFHILLATMTNSPILIRYVSEIAYRCCLTLSLYSRPHSSECGISEHLAIIDALEQGQAQIAMDLMHSHLDSVATRALVVPTAKRSRDLLEVLAPYADGP